MALTKLTKNLIDGTFGTEWVSTIQTSNFTAEAAKGYFVNTTAGTITINLPAGVVGTEIVIQDYAGTFATNNVLLNANGSEKIQGDSTTQGQITTNNATATLVYQDATKGWTSQDVSLVPVGVTVNYLVVAGGGGGGYDDAGGAGAGGLRTSWPGGSGGGGASETSLLLNVATNYIITLGAGGAGGQAAAASSGLVPQPGNTSRFDSISSAGGGPGLQLTGVTGGSGSGGSGNTAGSNAGSGTAGQGYAGGAHVPRTNQDEAGGGGGGAGAIGGNASAYTGGVGGVGKTLSISGSAATYAGGGGGGGRTSGGAGGSGGGAAGTGAANPANATVNTGGGGGSAGANSGSWTGSQGGSGIVILRYPSSFTISGSPIGSTITSGGDKITTFTNAGTGNIQFN